MQKHQLAIVAVERNQPAPKFAGMLKHHPASRAGYVLGYCDKSKPAARKALSAGTGKFSLTSKSGVTR
jgi:dihydroxyacid dehydratase/phosphogluconate dehydratase